MLLCISGLNAQTECTLKIEYTVDEVSPPAYTFNISPQTDVAQYYWTFGDNSTSDSPTPKHSFNVTDTYVIQAKVIKPDGSECYGKLEARFEGVTTVVNILTGKGKVMESTVQGCGLIISTDNGTILHPSEIVPEFTLKPGQYVEIAYELLDKASECGKVAKIHRIFEIAQVCNVPIEYVKADKAGVYRFVTSEQPVGTTYKWYFSDKTTSDSPTPVHEFISSGSYVVELLVTKPDGTKCNGRIEARFDGSTITPVILTGKGKVIEKTGCNLVIMLENSTVLVPVEMIPQFTLKPGQYVELAYELLDKASECGKVAKIHRISEIAQVCNVPIEYVKTDKVGVYRFVTSEQPVGTTYKWYFSDKTTSDSPTPVHEFITSGSYVVELLVTKPDGTKCNGRIEARFDGVTSPVLSAKGKVLKLTVAGCDLVISLENGTTLIPAKMSTDFILKENQYVEITYEKLGEKITNCNEGIEVNILTIKEIVVSSECKAYFSVSMMTGATTNTKNVEFTNESIGEIRECVWNFGDNTTSYSTSKTLNHEYALPGEYKVCLIIATTTGCKSDYCTTVKIGSTTECNFDLVIKPKEASPNTFLFEAISSAEISGWKWNFGDGTVSDTKNPEHTYEISGTYEVTCTILTAGCFSTKTVKHNVIIPSLPNCTGAVNLLLFDPTDNTCNGKAIVKLLNENAVEIENVKYIWSDGQTGSTVENLCPDRNYTIKSVIEGVCQKYTSFTMLSKPIWHATSFMGKNNFSVIEPKDGIEYEWDFGNGVILKGAEVNYDFEKDGIYEVKLTAISGNNFAEFSQQVVILKSITGTNIINSSEIKIFPNPVKNVINISFGNPVDKELNIEILSLTGQKVFSELVPFMELNQRQIDVQSLKQGIYFLRISNGHMLIAERKIIKAY